MNRITKFFPALKVIANNMRFWILLGLTATFVHSVAGSAKAQEAVNLELVLAVDASSSVTSWEFNLQLQGLADAFRDPEVQDAVLGRGDQGIAVALIQWASKDMQVVAIDWQVLANLESIKEFASAIDNTPRYITGGSTAIGNVIRFSVDLLDYNAYVGQRRVVDISGDGKSNQGSLAEIERDRAVASGVVINGLAILNEDKTVDAYYRTYVIGGPGAFIMSATDYRDFSRAIKQKLVREISGPPVAMLKTRPLKEAKDTFFQKYRKN